MTAADLRVNVGCGPHRAPAPWLNVDLIDEEGIAPDLVVPSTDPLALFAGLYDLDRDNYKPTHAYLGHVLEHIAEPDVVDYLVGLRRQVLAPGARVVIVGPDVYRTIEGHADGRFDWQTVLDVIEDRHHRQHRANRVGARHLWNCHEARLVEMVREAGYLATAVDIGDRVLDEWPVVSRVGWQCAVIADVPLD